MPLIVLLFQYNSHYKVVKTYIDYHESLDLFILPSYPNRQTDKEYRNNESLVYICIWEFIILVIVWIYLFFLSQSIIITTVDSISVYGSS